MSYYLRRGSSVIGMRLFTVFGSNSEFKCLSAISSLSCWGPAEPVYIRSSITSRDIFTRVREVPIGSSIFCTNSTQAQDHTRRCSSKPPEQTAPLSDQELRTAGPQVSDSEFQRLADFTIEHLLSKVEAYLEDLDLDDVDVEYGQGVLTLNLGPLRGTFVINKQGPNRQIWLSSPVSGPFRYDFLDGHWLYHRDGHDLLDRLERELQQLCGMQVDLHP